MDGHELLMLRLVFPEKVHDQPFLRITMNIGSLKTSKLWKASDTDVTCLQETRIGKNNFRRATQDVKALHRTLFCGDLLAGIIRSDGAQTTMHGGTAIIASDVYTKPFRPDEDVSGTYAKVFATKRANACWVQVTASIRVLNFSIYARSGASASQEILEENETLFHNIFQVVSQFGNVPVILAGDFQTDPLSYPSVANAIHFHGWQDPLLQVSGDGSPFRPITYSKDSTFSGASDGCSSIDAIVLNSIAFNALREIYVLEVFQVQHRPIKAIFAWESLVLEGDIHQKTAPLDTSSIPIRGHPGSDRVESMSKQWEDHFQPVVQDAPDFESAWANLNKFCLSALLQAGATWGHGPRERASSFC